MQLKWREKKIDILFYLKKKSTRRLDYYQIEQSAPRFKPNHTVFESRNLEPKKGKIQAIVSLENGETQYILHILRSVGGYSESDFHLTDLQSIPVKIKCDANPLVGIGSSTVQVNPGSSV